MPEYGNAGGPIPGGRAVGDSTVYDSKPTYHTGDRGISSTEHNNNIMNNLSTFFGEPTRAQTGGKDYYASEYSDYPEAFNKYYGSGPNNDETSPGAFTSNGYLSKVLIEKTKASDMWVLNAAPLMNHTNGSLVFTWDTVTFNKHLLDREPEESTPRLMTTTKDTASASMVRYGIALMMESGFASTEVGKSTYLNNIEQIKVATVESIAYGIMCALVEHERYNHMQASMRNSGAQRSKQDIDKLFKEEVRNWAGINKSHKGYARIIADCDRELSSRPNALAANLTIVPQGVARFVEETSRDKFYLTGTDVAQAIKVGTGSVVESRGFTSGSNNPHHDPLYRNQTIGGFASLDDSSLHAAEPADYRTAHLNFYGYCEDIDNFYLFRYVDHYKQTGIWNFDLSGAPCTSVLGKGILHDTQCYTYGQLHRTAMRVHEHVIDKLYLLSPEKQIDFLQTLRLLPENDSRISDRNAGDNFSLQSFNGMLGSDMQWDVQYSAGVRRSMAQRMSHGVASAPGDDLDAFQQHTRERRAEQGDGDAYARYGSTNPDDYEERKSGGESGDDDDDDSMDDDHKEHERPLNRTYRNGVERVYAAQAPTSVRRLKTITPLRGLLNTQTSKQNVIGALLRDLRDISGSQLSHAQNLAHRASEDGAFFGVSSGSAITESTFGGFLAQHIHVITVQLSTITLDQRVALLTSLRHAAFRAARKALATVRSADELAEGAIGQTMQHLTAAELAACTSEVISNTLAAFVPAYTSVQTLMSVRNITQNATPLERLVTTVNEDLGAIASGASSAQLASGWFNPSAAKNSKSSEDGQLSLLCTVSPGSADQNAVTLGVEHDAFVASLTARNTVYLSLYLNRPTVDANKMYLSYGEAHLHRVRRDALVWSIFLSYIAAGWITTPAKALAEGFASGTDFDEFLLDADRDLLDRLTRHGNTAGINSLLPTQLHLLPIHAKALEALRDILAAGVYVVRRVLGTPIGASCDLRDADRAALASSIARITRASAQAIEPLTRLEREMITILALDAVDAQHVTAYDAALTSRVLPSTAIVDGFTEVARTLRYAALMAETLFLAKRAKRMLAALPASYNKYVDASEDVVEGRAEEIFGLLAAHYAKAPRGATTLSKTRLNGNEWSRQFIRSVLDRASLTSGEYYRFAVDNDIPLPFALTLWRPNKTYNMGSLVRMVAGPNGAGCTPYKNPNFMMVRMRCASRCARTHARYVDRFAHECV